MKRRREDQWQEHGPKFHFVLWDRCEGAFTYEEPLTLERALSDAASGSRLCEECDGVVDPWRRGLDAVHACLRMTAKEGRAFRPEVLDFVALSPQSVLAYNIEAFRMYNKRRKKNVLTESTVLAAPVHVMQGKETSQSTGITVERLEAGGAVAWLRHFSRTARQMAEAENGVSALVMVQEEGVQVVPFGVNRQFCQKQNPEIRQIIVLLFGQDATNQDLALLKNACMEGCHVGPFHLSLPSWRQPHYAIGDLLMQHDRQELLPFLEDLRSVGEEEYREFQALFRKSITCIALAPRSRKSALVARFASFGDGTLSAQNWEQCAEPKEPRMTPTPPSEPPPPWLPRAPAPGSVWRPLNPGPVQRPAPCPDTAGSPPKRPKQPGHPPPQWQSQPKMPERPVPTKAEQTPSTLKQAFWEAASHGQVPEKVEQVPSQNGRVAPKQQQVPAKQLAAPKKTEQMPPNRLKQAFWRAPSNGQAVPSANGRVLPKQQMPSAVRPAVPKRAEQMPPGNRHEAPKQALQRALSNGQAPTKKAEQMPCSNGRALPKQQQMPSGRPAPTRDEQTAAEGLPRVPQMKPPRPKQVIGQKWLQSRAPIRPSVPSLSAGAQTALKALGPPPKAMPRPVCDYE
ncbi:unnamed protein product [Effrenium voratum]|nr:unnamed protein product [Effrenium voratum]